MPGPDWVRLFIKRHNLTKLISDNVKAARAEVTRDVIKNYFNHLEKWVIVPPECIYNFDETMLRMTQMQKQLSAEGVKTESKEK